MHVLLVEEDDAVADLLQTLLIDAGFSVTVIADITSLCDLSTIAIHPDIVLCDVGWPEGLKIELCERILGHYPASWLVVMSDVPELRNCTGLQEERVGFLRKPFSISAFRESICTAALGARASTTSAQLVSSVATDHGADTVGN